MNNLLKNKINEAFKRPYVGDFQFSEGELSSIFQEATKYLSMLTTRGATISESQDELIFVAIVNAIKTWGSDTDSSLFEFIRHFFAENVTSGKIYTCITEIIDRLFQKRKIYTLTCFTKKYYATLISHAFAPIKSTDSFFELCWQIYCKDLNQTFIKNDRVFELLTAQLKKRFINQSDDEDFKLGSQIYCLRAGIKGLAIDKPELMTALIEETITSINKVFCGEIINKENHYLNRLIVNWWKRKEASLGLEHRRQNDNSEREHIASDYSLIKPRYSINNDIVVLELEPFRLQSDFSSVPCLTVLDDNQEIVSFDLATKGSGLLMATCPFALSLAEHKIRTKNLTIKIELEGKEIYTSKKSLHRPFILFKDNKEVLTQNCLPGNYLLYIPDINELSQYPDEIQRISKNHYVFYAKEGEILQGCEKTIFFETTNTKHEIWLYASKRLDMVYRQDGNDYEVIEGNASIAIAPQTNTLDFGVRYNGAQFRLNDFAPEEKSDGIYFPITSILKVGEPQSINIFKYSTNQVIGSINIIKFQNINLEYDSDIYYEDSSAGIVSFKADNFDSSEIFTIDEQEVLVPIENGDIIVSPPTFSWSIDSKEKHYSYFEKGLWYEELNNSSALFINVPNNFIGQLLFSTGQEIPQNTDGSYKIGQALYSLVGIQKKPIEIIFRVETSTGPRLFPITKVHFQEEFKIAPVYVFKQKNIIWNPSSFIGPAKASFRLDLIGSNNKKVSTPLTLHPQKFIIKNLCEGYYKLQIVYEKKGIVKKEHVLFSKDICIGNEKNFLYKDAILCVTKAMLRDASEPVKIKPFCIENLRYAETRDGFDFYTGSIFIDSWTKGKITMDKMQNDNNGYDVINPIRIEMRDKTTCWIVYGLEDIKDLDNFESEFSYDPAKNQISISDIKTKGIIYYEFERK